jgi:nucleoside-diphosphate-sugar epimerase
MKVMVTGGSGFIGSHVVDKLIDRGLEVRIYDTVMPKYTKGVEFYQGSILDKSALGFALDGIDAVYHLAAVADVKDVFITLRRSMSGAPSTSLRRPESPT